MCCAQSCPTLCDSVDCSPPGSSVHGILQARILEWVAMPSCRGSSQPRNQTGISDLSPALQADSLPAELPGRPKSFQAPQACPDRITQTLRGPPTPVLTSPSLAPCPVTPHPLPLLFYILSLSPSYLLPSWTCRTPGSFGIRSSLGTTNTPQARPPL